MLCSGAPGWSRQPGSIAAATAKRGGLLLGPLSVPPMGTPWVYPFCAKSPCRQISFGRSNPPNMRATGRVPLVAKVSRRLRASKIESREFSSAHTPVIPPPFVGSPTINASLSASPDTTKLKSPWAAAFEYISASVALGVPLWLSVAPTKPLLNGLMPFACWYLSPSLRTLRTKLLGKMDCALGCGINGPPSLAKSIASKLHCSSVVPHMPVGENRHSEPPLI